MEGRLGLSQVIASLRSELYDAMVEGAGKLLQFKVGEVELEFQVEVAREAEGSMKVRFWVVEAGGGGTRTSTSTQILKLHLQPIDAVTKAQAQVADDGKGSAAPQPA